MSFPSRPEYESLLYHLREEHPEVLASTVHLYSTSALTAIVRGELTLNNGLIVQVLEILDFKQTVL